MQVHAGGNAGAGADVGVQGPVLVLGPAGPSTNTVGD
jgi:hypothetical protein